MSHAQLAEKAGLSHKYWYLCETGKRLPSAQAAYQLGKAVGMTEAELAGFFGDIRKEAFWGGFTDELSKIAELSENAELQAAIRGLVRVVVENALQAEDIDQLGKIAVALKKE
jgi:transcriptional regulator with XRE-family HTH domain